jgi:hypothetical protein
MEATAEGYRERAFSCEKMAEEATDQAIRKQWEELAIQWHYMANQAARLSEMLKNISEPS